MNLFTVLTELPQILLPALVSMTESMGLCSSTRSLLQKLQSVKTRCQEPLSLHCLSFFFLTIRLLFLPRGHFSLVRWAPGFNHLFVQAHCLLPASAPGKQASPYLDPWGRADLQHPPWGKSHFQGGNPLPRGNISTSLGITAPGKAVHPHHNQPNKPRVPCPLG